MEVKRMTSSSCCCGNRRRKESNAYKLGKKTPRARKEASPDPKGIVLSEIKATG